MLERSLPNMGVFSISHITAFLHLETLDSTSALHLGAIVKSEITNKKHRNAKNTTLNKLRKGHLLSAQELNKKAKSCFDQLLWEQV